MRVIRRIRIEVEKWKLSKNTSPTYNTLKKLNNKVCICKHLFIVTKYKDVTPKPMETWGWFLLFFYHLHCNLSHQNVIT